jgi:hypothetical protein
MGKLIFALIVFVLGLGASRALASMAAAPSGPWQRAARGLHLASRAVFAVGVVLPALIVLLSTFKVIPAGHVGVATLFGQVQPKPLQEGLNFINPLLDVTQMSTQVQRRTGRYDAASKDLQAVHVEMVLNYRLIPERAPDVYQKIGVNYESVIIDPAAQEVLKANTALHNAAEILQKRQIIKSDVQKDVTTWLVKYGVEMKEAALANIRFDPAYEKAIEAKQIGRGGGGRGRGAAGTGADRSGRPADDGLPGGSSPSRAGETRADRERIAAVRRRAVPLRRGDGGSRLGGDPADRHGRGRRERASRDAECRSPNHRARRGDVGCLRDAQGGHRARGRRSRALAGSHLPEGPRAGRVAAPRRPRPGAQRRWSQCPGRLKPETAGRAWP